MNKLSMWCVGLVCSLGGASAVWAQAPAGASADELQEVVVTAERFTSDVQKSAVSVSVRSGDALLEQGRFTLGAIIEDVPGVTGGAYAGLGFGGSDTQGSGVSIRGVDSSVTPQGAILAGIPTTAVYTDGVYEGVGGTYDIDRVEILRGPQGTLYGRSATAGVISIATHNPVLNQFGGDVDVEVGNHGLQHYSAALNLPIGDTLAIRIAGNEYERHGYYTGKGGDIDITDGRVKVLWQPNSDLSALVGIAYEDTLINTGGLYGVITAPNTFKYEAAPIESGNNNFHQYWADIEWNFGPATLTYLPALRTWYQDQHVYAPGPNATSALANLNTFQSTPFDQFLTQELRVASNSGSPLRWQGGLFYYDNRLRDESSTSWYTSNGLAFDAAARKQTKDLGVFGEATLAFADSWRATVGLRYDYTYVQTNEVYTSNLNQFCNTPVFFLGTAACGPGPVNSPNAGLPLDNVVLDIGGSAGTHRFYDLTYKARVEHDLTAANLLYGSVSTGFLPGDVRIWQSTGNYPTVGSYGQETLTSYELGSKNRFLNNALQINGDIFYYHYGAYQTQITPNVQNPASQQLVAIPARMKGGEIEVQYLLTPNDHVALNYGYVDAYFVDEPVLYSSNAIQTHMINVSPNTGTASYEHYWHLPDGSTLTPRADMRVYGPKEINTIREAIYAAGGEAYIRVPTQVLGDFNLAWASSGGKYSVTGYVRNVSNATWTQNIILQALSATSKTIYGVQSDPRTFGVVLHASF